MTNERIRQLWADEHRLEVAWQAAFYRNDVASMDRIRVEYFAVVDELQRIVKLPTNFRKRSKHFYAGIRL